MPRLKREMLQLAIFPLTPLFFMMKSQLPFESVPPWVGRKDKT